MGSQDKSSNEESEAQIFRTKEHNSEFLPIMELPRTPPAARRLLDGKGKHLTSDTLMAKMIRGDKWDGMSLEDSPTKMLSDTYVCELFSDTVGEEYEASEEARKKRRSKGKSRPCEKRLDFANDEASESEEHSSDEEWESEDKHMGTEEDDPDSSGEDELGCNNSASVLGGEVHRDLNRYAISGRSRVLGERYLVTKKGEERQIYDDEGDHWCDGVGKFIRNIKSVVENMDVDFNFCKDGNADMLLPETKLFMSILRHLNEEWTYKGEYKFDDEYDPGEGNINFFLRLLSSVPYMRNVPNEVVLHKVAGFLLNVGKFNANFGLLGNGGVWHSWALKPVIVMGTNGMREIKYDYIPSFYCDVKASDMRVFSGGEYFADFTGAANMSNAAVASYIDKYYRELQECMEQGQKRMPETAEHLNSNYYLLRADLNECMRALDYTTFEVTLLTVYGKMNLYPGISYAMAVLVDDLIWSNGKFAQFTFDWGTQDGIVQYWIGGGIVSVS